jgi:hypothetical protein
LGWTLAGIGRRLVFEKLPVKAVLTTAATQRLLAEHRKEKVYRAARQRSPDIGSAAPRTPDYTVSGLHRSGPDAISLANPWWLRYIH